MGSYTDLSVGGYPVLETKSYASSRALTIFRESDRAIFDRKLSERNVLVWGKPDAECRDEIEKAFVYRASIPVVKDRLNVMGFTLDRVEDEFHLIRDARIEEYASWLEDENEGWPKDSFNVHIREQIEILRSISFAEYLKSLKKIISHGKTIYEIKRDGVLDSDPIVKYITGDDEGYEFGFFCNDARSLIRAFCEVSEDDGFVVQDLTEVFHAGYYRETDEAANNAVESLTAGYPETARLIVLTEGSTDAHILDEAMTLLHPHLRDYYSFLDFESSRSSGGAGQLASLVKAFAGTGIKNRVIALFDNDTAGREAAAALKLVSLPSNIRVSFYPDINYLRTYDTIGPSGALIADVNRVAASIELYLGHDVLLEPSGERLPVQWKGYSEALRSYQGEVLHKNKIRERFFEKVRVARRNGTKGGDWTGLEAVLSHLFAAFHGSRV
jgi:HEPN superfamily Toprim-like protein